MGSLPFVYERIAPTTWAYLSSLLMLALFFKFNRFWSVRNLDMFLIILLAPGLLMIAGGQDWVANHTPLPQASGPSGNEPAVESDSEAAIQSPVEKSLNREIKPDANPATELDQANGSRSRQVNASPVATDLSIQDGVRSESGAPSSAESTSPLKQDEPEQANAPDLKPDLNTQGYVWQRWGYYWLFGVGAIFMIRMLIDPSLKRRPQLEPNLAIGGLVFFACSLMMFLFANIVTSTPTNEDMSGARNAVKLMQRKAAGESDTEQLRRRGPGYTLFNLFPIIPSFESGDAILETDADTQAFTDMSRYVIAAKSLAITSQVLMVLGLILFCYYNYNNFSVGVGTATIYLMLPYTAIFTGHVLHVLPAALILWAMVLFRRPWLAGILVGLATSVSYYPIFLLPLWASFYWERGVRRFMVGVLISIVVCICGLLFTSVDMLDFWHQLRAMFGFWWPTMNGLQGIWELGWNKWWRLPLLVAFVLLCVSFVAWPSEKNIGTLVSYSAAIMLAVQFWHGFNGGLYMAWYLPMVLLTFFRPNLDGRVAQAEVGEFKPRKKESAKDLLPAA